MSEHRGPVLSNTAFAALLVVTATLIVQALLDNYRLRLARTALESQFAQQREPLEQAQALRAQLEGIAGATAILAEQGNTNAIIIRDQLQQQGITIRPPQ